MRRRIVVIIPIGQACQFLVNDSVLLLRHIFPKAQVTSNKNAHIFRRHFRSHFLLLLHALAWETTFPLVEIFKGQSQTSKSRFLKLTLRKNRSHYVKEHEKLCLKMVSEIVCIFVCGHLSLWKDVPRKILRVCSQVQFKVNILSFDTIFMHKLIFWLVRSACTLYSWIKVPG